MKIDSTGSPVGFMVRTTTEQRVAIGADAEGKFGALIHSGVTKVRAARNANPARDAMPSMALIVCMPFLVHLRRALQLTPNGLPKNR